MIYSTIGSYPCGVYPDVRDTPSRYAVERLTYKDV